MTSRWKNHNKIGGGIWTEKGNHQDNSDLINTNCAKRKKTFKCRGILKLMCAELNWFLQHFFFKPKAESLVHFKQEHIGVTVLHNSAICMWAIHRKIFAPNSMACKMCLFNSCNEYLLVRTKKWGTWLSLILWYLCLCLWFSQPINSWWKLIWSRWTL